MSSRLPTISPPRVMYMHWYYNFIVRRPYLMVVAVSVLCTACIIVSLTMNSEPDFSDPTLGFETRGTALGKRLTAWYNLIQETGPTGALVADPNDLQLCAANHHAAKRRKHYHGRNRKRKNKHKPKGQRKKSNVRLNRTSAVPQNQLNDVSAPVHGTIYNETDQTEAFERSPTQWNGDNGIFRDYEITNDSWSSMEQLNRTERFEYGRNTTSIDEDFHRVKIQKKKKTWRTLKQAPIPPAWGIDGSSVSIEGYFCDSPSKAYSHFVVERIGPNASDSSLFDLNGLLAMCQLQNQIVDVPNYGEFCHKEVLTDNCCRPWSLPNYAALLVNKSSCFDLNVTDVAILHNLLVGCFEYFHDLKLSNDCSVYSRCPAPLECKRNNIVFNILHFLTDYNFIKLNDSKIFLKYAMVFVPVAHSSKVLPLFHAWERIDLKNELVQVISMDLGLENELFNECLLTDGWLVGLGGAFVMTCIWLYTTSVFVTVMTFVAVLFSLGLAYFVYTLVFEMSFFPYMNLLAVVVIIGIGADNAFLFVKIWQCVLAERFTKTSTITTHSHTTSDGEHTETLQNLMAQTFNHAALSMFVSSLTTAAAFYASYTSSITAIKCFGIFAGTVAIANYLLMMTWLPAVVSIMERLSACTNCSSKLPLQKLLLMLNKSINKFCNLFETIITRAVINYAPLWIFLFGAVGICSAVIVLYAPGLQLPETAHFQLFTSNHPFEIYNTKMKNEFWFEKSMSAFENFKLPLRFVWGILPVDDGDYTDPFSHGNLHYDNNFNISTKAAQIWLLSFCKSLRQQPFYQITFGLLLPNCFIENFISFMGRMCIDGMDNTDRTPCCDVSKFPYEPHVFELCLPLSISSLYATPREYFIPGVAGPKFFTPHQHYDNSDEALNENFTQPTGGSPPQVKAIVIEFESNVSYTTAYSEVKSFVQAVDEWFSQELSRAPAELQGGWFISELKFFDTQNTLSRDTLVAISVAMSASLALLLLVTLNVLVSLYAVVTVSLTIFTTVAVLILLGWKLNVLESIAVSTAIGLAVDFSLHYGIHYRMSPTCERLAATQFTLSRIVGPTAMAALTTGFAGGLMIASNVLPYIQIGIFLVIVMTVSWLYGTFFLMGLLKIAGPQYGFMQFKYPRISNGATTNGIKYYERKQSQVIASEQLLTPSSSAVGELINSETHELESLTSNSLIKTISGMDCSHAVSVDFEHSFNNRNEKLVEDDARACSTTNHKRPSIDSATSELPAVAKDAINF